jgi:hypothetical protein
MTTFTAPVTTIATVTRVALPSRIGTVCASDAHRYAMNSVLVHRPAGASAAYAVATDGRALAVARIDPASHSLACGESLQLPAKACQIRAKAKGPLPEIVANKESVTSEGKIFQASDQSLRFPPVDQIWKAPATSSRVARVSFNPELLLKLADAMAEHRADTKAVEIAFEVDDVGNARGRAIIVQTLNGAAAPHSSAGLLMPCSLSSDAPANATACEIVARAKRILDARE